VRIERYTGGGLLPIRGRGRQSQASIDGYETAITKFCDKILKINETLDFRVSSRGWCYILEGHYGLLKSDFSTAQRIINECRKSGRLPLDICSDDEGRATFGLESVDYANPEREAEHALAYLRKWHTSYTPFSFWDELDYYVEMAVEKIDLRSLFAPVCEHFHVPLFNASGWADINSRAAMMERFAEKEAEGKHCVLLYCGDHDPGGLHISDFLHENLVALEGAVGWSPDSLEIVRFGLDYDFIEAQGLSWIENLETANGKYPLDDPRHPDHDKPYVQNYLKRFGARKVEANALVVRPEAGRALCREAILRYVSEEDVTAYEAKVAAAREELRRVIEGRLA
jgi:hypothetical protein